MSAKKINSQVRWVTRKSAAAEFSHETSSGEKVYKDDKYVYVQYISNWDGKKMYYKFRRTVYD